MYDPDIVAALSGQLDHDTAGDRIALKAAVGKQMFDNATGALLDARRAVLITATPPTGRAVMEVFDAERWDAIGEAMLASAARNKVTVEVVDGRTAFADPS